MDCIGRVLKGVIKGDAGSLDSSSCYNLVEIIDNNSASQYLGGEAWCFGILDLGLGFRA